MCVAIMLLGLLGEWKTRSALETNLLGVAGRMRAARAPPLGFGVTSEPHIFITKGKATVSVGQTDKI